MKFFILAACFLTFTGCATQSRLDISSQPMGAYITELKTSVSLGIAPTTSYYNATDLQNNVKSDGCYYVRGFKAQWVSGTTATTASTIKLCGSSTGTYNITITRNDNAPNLEKDLNFAMQVQNTLAQQQQAKAAQNAAFAQMWSAYSVSQGINSMTNCSSYMSGNTLKTNCR